MISNLFYQLQKFLKKHNITNQSFKFTRNVIYFKLLEIEIENNFNKDGKLEFDSNIYYKYKNLQKDHHRLQHESRILDDEDNLLHKIILNKTNSTDLDFNTNIMLVKDNFYVTFKNNYNKIKIILDLYRVYRHGSGEFDLELINENFINVMYLDKNNIPLKINTNTGNISNNLDQINTNTGNISSNLEKINDNAEDIVVLQNSNVKASYNLDQIFIYDIKAEHQIINKDNRFHIFEKEITYDFAKNSYLEIILKVLTEISNYVLIGFFQILCNFYNQDNTLFYTISLSTAMGSINKLSTIKSVFIVPINENMSKIKIDFFITPKETQQSRTATFTIKDINSNKIYVKYYQKTDEMSIKDIKDSLNTVKNISTLINSNTESISTNLGKIDNFTQYILQSGKDFEEKYTIEKQIFKFNKDKHFYTIFEKEIEYDFTKNSLLFVKNNMYYKYDNLSNDYYRLQHEYNIYDGDNLIHKYLFNKDTYYDENLDPILHTSEDFCICFKKNYKKIKLNLQLHRHNRHGIGNINLEIDDNDNYINIDYVDRNNNEKVDTNTESISTNLEKINDNKNNISTNLIKINSNEDDILYNLNEINHLKNNNSTQYLKNIYNILFYDKKTQISFRNYFFEKVFDVNANINDFIEMSFKISLQYENISDRAYVKTLYELFDENDNSLYIKSVNNNDYSYYSNKIFIDENIFYNFTKNIKKIKFVIKFQMILSRVIKIWYIKNDNYRLILKHYST